MPKVNDLSTSKYLKKEDLDGDVLVTITGYEEVNVAMKGDKAEMKWALHLEGLEKPLVLNITNGRILEAITGSDDFDDWIGTEIVLFNDLTVVFNNKVGGLRVRPSKLPLPGNRPKPRSDGAPPPTDDDVPPDDTDTDEIPLPF